MFNIYIEAAFDFSKALTYGDLFPKKHVETLMSQYDDALEMLEVKGKIERDDAMEIASLKDNLEEEHELRVYLEEQLESIEGTNNSIVAKLIKERDHARAKHKVCKKEKVELGVGHSRLTEELEKLSKAHKALEPDTDSSCFCLTDVRWNNFNSISPA